MKLTNRQMHPLDPLFERKARDLFLRLIELTPGEREVALADERLEPRVKRRARDLLDLAGRRRPRDEDEPGSRVLPRQVGPFTVVALLGRSPTSTVLLARRSEEEEPLALKILRRGLGAGDVARRFRQEREILSRFDHPGIARLVDFGKVESEEGKHEYIATRYVPGRTLREAMEDAPSDPHSVFGILDQILESVAHAHDRGVIHRDLKPENLKITPDGRVVVLDFGVSRQVEKQRSDVTLPGQIVGTLRYMSPEQLASDEVGPASDLYSIGMIGYELLTGKPPFDIPESSLYHSVIAVAAAELQPLPGDLKQAYPGLQDFLFNALNKDPEHRYQDAAEMRAELRLVQEGRPVKRRGGGHEDPGPGHPSGRKIGVAMATLVLVAVMAWGLAGFLGVRQPAGLNEASLQKATAASQFAIDKLHFEERRQESTLAAIERLEDAYLELASQPGRGAVLAWLLANRLGEAHLILGGLTREPTAFRKAAHWYNLALNQESVTAASLNGLPEEWAIRDHFREIGLQYPAVGKAAAHEGLARVARSERNLMKAAVAHNLALQRLERADSLVFAAGASRRARLNALAILHNDRARVAMTYANLTGDQASLEEAFASFAVVDSLGILADRQPLAHASFLLGLGEAYFRRFEMHGRAADLDSALARLDRAMVVGGAPRHHFLHVHISCLLARARVALARSREESELRDTIITEQAFLTEILDRPAIFQRLSLRFTLEMALADLMLELEHGTGTAAGLGRMENRLATLQEEFPADGFPAMRGEILFRRACIAQRRELTSAALDHLHELRLLAGDIGRPRLLRAAEEMRNRLSS